METELEIRVMAEISATAKEFADLIVNPNWKATYCLIPDCYRSFHEEEYVVRNSRKDELEEKLIEEYGFTHFQINAKEITLIECTAFGAGSEEIRRIVIDRGLTVV